MFKNKLFIKIKHSETLTVEQIALSDIASAEKPKNYLVF